MAEVVARLLTRQWRGRYRHCLTTQFTQRCGFGQSGRNAELGLVEHARSLTRSDGRSVGIRCCGIVFSSQCGLSPAYTHSHSTPSGSIRFRSRSTGYTRGYSDWTPFRGPLLCLGIKAHIACYLEIGPFFWGPLRLNEIYSFSSMTEAAVSACSYGQSVRGQPMTLSLAPLPTNLTASWQVAQRSWRGFSNSVNLQLGYWLHA